jgi:hypothetical protein
LQRVLKISAVASGARTKAARNNAKIQVAKYEKSQKVSIAAAATQFPLTPVPLFARHLRFFAKLIFTGRRQ